MPRKNAKNDTDMSQNRQNALDHARRRLQRTYGMKGESSFNAEELDELRQIFEFYDIDNSKTMDLRELNKALTALGYHASEKDVKYLATTMDVDGDMTMDFSEFCMIVEFMREEKGLEEELRDAFRCIDTTDSGYVTAQELLKLLMSEGNTMSLSKASNVVAFIDKNGDGMLDYKEFIRAVTESRNASQSMTTLYSTAASSENSLQSECGSTSKSSSGLNSGRETSVEEFSASFKTAVSSNTNAEMAENFQMVTLSPKPTPHFLSEEMSLTATVNSKIKTEQACTSLKLTSSSQDDETEQPTEFEVPSKPEDKIVKKIAEGGRRECSVQENSASHERPKLRRESKQRDPSVAIKVVGPTAGKILGSVVLENPPPQEE